LLISSRTGAVNAFHDAVVLANYIGMLESNDPEEITSLFQQYWNERAPKAKEAVNVSRTFAKFLDKVRNNFHLPFAVSYVSPMFLTPSFFVLSLTSIICSSMHIVLVHGHDSKTPSELHFPVDCKVRQHQIELLPPPGRLPPAGERQRNQETILPAKSGAGQGQDSIERSSSGKESD
jgi:hypothetical protein